MAGWRIGWLHGPKDVVSDVLKIHQHVNTHTCTFTQKAACACFKLDMDFLENYKKELSEKVIFLVDAISNYKCVSVCLPKGGLFAFVDISGTNKTSDDFAS